MLDAGPEIYNHNTETVPRLYKKARPGGRYPRVMEIFRFAKRVAPDIPTKTGMILGMGETVEEVIAVMHDLREVDVDILTLGQYLRPSDKHIALDRYYTPAEFRRALRNRDGDGIPSRRVRSARAIELPRLGAGPGGGRMTHVRLDDETSDGRRNASDGERQPAPPRREQRTAPDDQAALRKDLLRSMLLQRRFEERCAEAYALGKIGGFCHLYIGQEAISAGTMSMLRPDDYVVTSYRDHGQAIARGMTPRSVMAELFGRMMDARGGKGGSMHLFDKNLNFLGGHGIVGGHIPLAAGVGWAIKYRGGDQVCVCFFGEAAVNIGAFHEALNMASLWKLPVCFMIENNRYGMGTAISRATANEDVVARAAAYRMLGESVDAQDVFAVRDAVGRAVELRAQGKAADAARDAHLSLHGPLDVRCRERNVSHEGRARGEHEARSDPSSCAKDALRRASCPEGDFAKIDEEAEGDRAGCVGFRRRELPSRRSRIFTTDVLVDTTS